MLKKAAKPENAQPAARRKLTRAERKQIEAIIRQAKGDGKPHTVQDSIPFRNLYPDGLCRLDDRLFSKTIAYEDVNYRLAGPDDQRDIFERLCDFYNGYDPSIGVQMTLSSRHEDKNGNLFGMEKADNEMYALVDEEFLAKFSNQHLNYMKKLYYSFYAGYCKRIKRKPLTSEDFFKNMHLRRFQLYQLCCPYCGTVSLCIHDKKESKTAGYNFCHSCGRTSTLKNIQKHLARFVRIKRMNRISIQAVAEHRPETEKWLLAYDCYQIEIIELASIIEVLFRDYFEALLFISCESKKDSFLEKIVRKYTGNDFMNIEKTNDIYKKAFGIEIRKNLNAETWDDLLDIVNLRNMIVHNNGQVDKRFESTSTFRRWKDRVDIPLIKIEDEDIAKLLSSVIDAVTIISNLYLKEYYQRRNRVIANYYFNKENAYDFFADTE